MSGAKAEHLPTPKAKGVAPPEPFFSNMPRAARVHLPLLPCAALPPHPLSPSPPRHHVDFMHMSVAGVVSQNVTHKEEFRSYTCASSELAPRAECPPLVFRFARTLESRVTHESVWVK